MLFCEKLLVSWSSGELPSTSMVKLDVVFDATKQIVKLLSSVLGKGNISR